MEAALAVAVAVAAVAAGGFSHNDWSTHTYRRTHTHVDTRVCKQRTSAL